MMDKKMEMVMNIFAKCLEINGMEERMHENGNRPAVFFDFSGHIASIALRWYTNGWTTGLDPCEHLQLINISSLDEKWYAEIMDKLTALQNHTSEIALDCDIQNLANVKKLAVGEIFMVKTPIDSLHRGEVVQTDKGKRYKIKGIKGGAEITFASLKKHIEYLLDLKMGVA